MQAIKRYELIMELLTENKEVTVAELSEHLGVTGKTIREDLGKLEEKGLLHRVHGGAVLTQDVHAGILSAGRPNVKNVPEKKEIAQRAAAVIEPEDIIALDGGSTTLEIARLIENEPLTVITNDLLIIGELARKDRVRLVVPGGYRVRNNLVNPEAPAYIRKLNIRKAFVSATAIHRDFGLSIYTGDLADIKRAFVETAKSVICVADHDKFDRCALITFAALSEIDIILSDSGLPEAVADSYRRQGVRIDIN